MHIDLTPMSSTLLERKMHMDDGLVVNYVIAGHGRHNILFMSGALSTWHSFEAQLHNLDASKFTMVAWDPIGYGKTVGERKFDRHMFRYDADVAFELMQKLHLRKFSIISWCDGSRSSILMASNEKYAPHIRSMILIGASSIVTANDIEAMNNIKDVNKWNRSFLNRMHTIYGKERLASLWRQRHNLVCNIYGVDGDICLSALSKIDTPTLIIHGVRDTLIPVEHAYHMHRHMHCARWLIIVEQGKHDIHDHCQAWFNAVASDFLLTGVVDDERYDAQLLRANL